MRLAAILALLAAGALLAACKGEESEPCPTPSATAAATAPAPPASAATVPASTGASASPPRIEACCAAIEQLKVPKKQAGLVVSALGLCRRAEGAGGMFTLGDVRTVLEAAKLPVPKECGP